MKLAQIQMHVTADKAANLCHAEELLRSVRGADMAILPEMFCCPYDNSCFRAYGEPAGGAAYQMLSRTARELGLWLVGGSLPELDDGRVYNTSFVFDPQGACVARHRKMHLFDIDVEGGQRFRESDTLSPGTMSPCSIRRGEGWDCASASTCGSRSCAASWRWRARGCCWQLSGLQHDHRPRPLGAAAAAAGGG